MRDRRYPFFPFILIAAGLAWNLGTIPPAHARHGRPQPQPEHPAPLSASQAALDRAVAARRNLEKRQREAALHLQAQQETARVAQDKAMMAQKRAELLADRSRAAKATLTETQHKITELETSILALRQDQARLRAAMSSQNRALFTFLPVLIHVSASPYLGLLTAPQRAPRAVTALAMISGMTRLTQQRVGTLQTQQAQFEALSQRLASHEATLNDLRLQQTRQAALALNQQDHAQSRSTQSTADALLAQNALKEARQNAAALSDAIAALAQQESLARASLEAEARRLAREHQMARARQAQAQADTFTVGTAPHAGHGHAPVSGPVVVHWGQNTEAGPATGVTYAAPPLAPVSAPCAGLIEFAGPFRSFGQMLILHCGPNYRFVLAGLGSLAVSTGQMVKASGNLGRMPSQAPRLFVQLHRNIQIVSPLPFL